MIHQAVEAFAATLSTHSKSRTASINDPKAAYEIALAWTIRLWFAGRAHPESLRLLKTDHPNLTWLQQTRILFTKGFTEPSSARRIRGFPSYSLIAEPTTWWEETLAYNNQPIIGEIPTGILQQKWSVQEFAALFPHWTIPQILSSLPLASSDQNSVRFARYARALNSFSGEVTHDTDLRFLTRSLPPESLHREYKATFRCDSQTLTKNPHQLHSCLKTITAFLNSEGGQLIVGVNDDGEVIGISPDLSLLKEPNLDTLTQVIHEAIKTNITPFPLGLVTVEATPYGSHVLIIIQVSPSQCPHSCRQPDGTSTVFARDGNRTINLTKLNL
jgi:hypothetical protein